MNRADRRKAEKQQRHENNLLAGLKELSPRQKANIEATTDALAKIRQNGITEADLNYQYEAGVKVGAKKATEMAAQRLEQQLYPAVAMVLHEKYGFGAKRCCDVLNAIDDYIINKITTVDEILEAIEKIGIKFDWGEPFDRFSPIEKERKNKNE